MTAVTPFQESLRTAVEALQRAYPKEKRRIQTAMDLVLKETLDPVGAGAYVVHDVPDDFHVSPEGVCDCSDAAVDPARPCAHVFAVTLHQEAWAAIQNCGGDQECPATDTGPPPEAPEPGWQQHEPPFLHSLEWRDEALGVKHLHVIRAQTVEELWTHVRKMTAMIRTSRTRRPDPPVVREDLQDLPPKDAEEAGPATRPETRTVQRFAVDTLSCALHDGKQRWTAKGGYFTKYGVTCWPEVLKAAGLDLDPLQVHAKPGWTAEYVCKDDGKPEKVVRLIAP